MILRAENFGAVGDGKTDEGPAVARLLEAARKITNRIEIIFPSHKTFRLATGRDGYALLLDHAINFTLDGGNSLFLIDPKIRFLHMTNCWTVTVKNFRVDFSPLPFSDGLVIGKNVDESWFDVQISEGMVMPPLGGPTHQSDEQTYFGALWHPGKYSTARDPYLTREFFEVTELRESTNPSNRVVRVMANPSNRDALKMLETGKWRASLPVRGVAHIFGPGAVVLIEHNDEVTLENIEIWSAPWMAFTIIDNEGPMHLVKVNVRPKPGTARSLSSWRDGFHVKNNRSRIFWENCTLQGMGDDAFNIACHASTVKEIYSPTRFRIQQNFPLGIASIRPEDFLVAYDETRGALLGRARIVSIVTTNKIASQPGEAPSVPIVVLEIAEPLAGMEADKTLVWDENSSNPHSLLRNCRVDVSCRFRSPVAIEHSQINALLWFTGDEIEAPVPRDISVTDSQLRIGQGNPNLAVIVDGPRFGGRAPDAPMIYNVLFENDKIYGDFVIRDSASVTLNNNLFMDGQRRVEFQNVAGVQLIDNQRGGKLISTFKDLTVSSNDANEIKIRNSTP